MSAALRWASPQSATRCGPRVPAPARQNCLISERSALSKPAMSRPSTACFTRSPVASAARNSAASSLASASCPLEKPSTNCSACETPDVSCSTALPCGSEVPRRRCTSQRPSGGVMGPPNSGPIAHEPRSSDIADAKPETLAPSPTVSPPRPAKPMASYLVRSAGSESTRKASRTSLNFSLLPRMLRSGCMARAKLRQAARTAVGGAPGGTPRRSKR
mmetsp:Transcript_46747/g.120200  ORF Transcript_46747/g.120200 Transcript_46747/m.120200 type:complete len:217 (+) Transcript_46747:718-1368(+)